MNNIYFDTNIVLDLLDNTRKYHNYSYQTFSVINNNLPIYINTESLSNIFYILKNRYKFDLLSAIERIENIKNTFEIIYPTIAEINYSIELCKTNKFNDYEDALQYSCALKQNCDLIITNNIKDFKNSKIKVLTSQEFVNIL